MKEWFQLGIYTVAGVIVVGLIGWYVVYVWSDCLSEHSFLTCARMLK